MEGVLGLNDLLGIEFDVVRERVFRATVSFALKAFVSEEALRERLCPAVPPVKVQAHDGSHLRSMAVPAWPNYLASVSTSGDHVVQCMWTKNH